MKNPIKNKWQYAAYLTVLFCSFTIINCTTSEKNINTKTVSSSGTGENTSSNAVKETENKTAENKSVSEKTTLWDFRKNDLSKDPKMSKAETDAVVKYLFGDQANQKLEIRNRLSGAFTKPNAKETLYYLTGCKDEDSNQFTTDCPHVSWDSEGWIAIYDGTNPVMKINQALGYRIEKITDVNGDGKNEFLSFSGYGQSGIQYGNISIGQISGDKYENIKGFNGFADNCGFGDTLSKDKKMAIASVISFIPTTNGKMPEFSEEYFQGKCKEDSIDNSSWEKITKKDFDEFFNSLS